MNKSKRKTTNAAVILAGSLAPVLAALAMGCVGDGGDAHHADTGALEAIEAESAVVIDEEASDVARVLADRIELPRLAKETRDRLKIGAVIVGRRGRSPANPHGFLRRVTKITSDGDGIVVTTSPATLGEAIQQGEVAGKTKPLDPYATSGGATDPTSVKPKADEDGNGSGETPMRFSHTFDAQTIVSTANFEARVEPTQTACTPTFDTALRLRGAKLDTLRFVMNDQLMIQTELSATARGRFDQNVTVPLFKNKIALPPQQIGPIPVVETVDVSVDLACDFSAEGSATARVGLRADFSYRFGVEYTNDKWHMVADAGELTLAPVGPTIEAQANTRLDCRIIPRVALLFYDVVGPYLSVTPRIVATANATGRYSPNDPNNARPVAQWALTGSLRAEAGLTGTITIPGAPSTSSLINDGIARSQLELFSLEKQWSGSL